MNAPKTRPQSLVAAVLSADRNRYFAVEAYLEEAYRTLKLPDENHMGFGGTTKAEECVAALSAHIRKKSDLVEVIPVEEIRKFVGRKWHLKF